MRPEDELSEVDRCQHLFGLDSSSITLIKLKEEFLMFARPVWQVVCLLLGKPQKEEELNSVSREQWLAFLSDLKSGEISTEEIVEVQENQYFLDHIEDFVSKKLKRTQTPPTTGSSCNMLY